MTTTRRLIVLLTGALVLLTSACTGGSSASPDSSKTGLDTPGTGLSRVILVGDSVARGQSLPLAAAFGVSKVEFHSMASDGGGTVIGPVSKELWKTLPDRISTARPSTVVYQITTYDWGSEAEQKAAYERLLSTVTGVGAKLVIVTMPPIKPDDFYRPHMKDLNRAAQVARQVAEASDGHAVVLDATTVWGSTYQRVKDGKPDRSSDGIHTCPQGAARFTNWFMDEMHRLYPTYTPPAAKDWANTGWSADKAFIGC